MKKLSLILLVCLLFVSCKDNATVQQSNNQQRQAIEGLPSGLAYDELIYCVSGGGFNEHLEMPAQQLYCYAYLSDEFENQNSASVNGAFLTRMDNYPTQLMTALEYDALPNTTLSWNLKNKNNVTYQFNQVLSNKLDVTSIQYKQVVYKNSDLVVNYTGATNTEGDSLLVRLEPAGVENYVLLGSNNPGNGKVISFAVPNNGSFTISSATLNSLNNSVDEYYQISLLNDKGELLTVNGKRIYCFSKYNYRTAFLLKNNNN